MTKKEMNKKNADQPEEPEHAWLIRPARDLVENFSINVLEALGEYLNVIRGDDGMRLDALGNYKVFNFGEASRVLTGSALCYAKKVDHVYELTLAFMDLVQNNEGGEGTTARRGGRRKAVNLGPTSYDLLDMDAIRNDALKHWDEVEKEEKKAVDNLRLVDNAELAEADYEKKSIFVVKPTQFMFKLDYGQLARSDQQILNSKSKPDVIGKVKDFDIKKSSILHEQQMVYTHDCYRNNFDQFTLPGARWIPDNKELATNFGIADIEAELDLEQEAEKVNAYGPFKDPLSGREVVAPPRWYIEQEAVKQQQEIQLRAASRAASTVTGFRDSQGFGSQPTRMSNPSMERQRNATSNLNQFVSFVEGRMNKNRPSTHLNTGLVDMFIDEFRNHDDPASKENQYAPTEVDYDYGGGGGDDYENDADDYVANLSRSHQRRTLPPWDDLDNLPRFDMYTGDDDIPVTSKPVKVLTKKPMRPVDVMNRKNQKEAKIGKTRRDEFMETHDYLQDHYYWRSAALVNPNKDWKVEALRTSVLQEKKRRAKGKTAKIREARERIQLRKRSTRGGIAPEDFEVALEGMHVQTNRRTLGAEYEDVADDDLAAEVEISMLGAPFDDDEDDVAPRAELPPSQAPNNIEFDDPAPVDFYQPQNTYQPLRFDDIDDAELNSIINLPGTLLIDKALPLLKKFAVNRTDREQMAYEMAKAYEDVDIAVSTLQEQVDNWHAKLEPILEEGETRKEYDVHLIGQNVLDMFEKEGDTKTLIELVVGKPWYEVSRYFLSCLFMCNVQNVMISENRDLPLEERINSMTISLLNREMHHEVFKQQDALD